MKEKVSLDTRKYYLSEFSLFDGENDITFNIVDICMVKNEITVAVTDTGKISVIPFDLKADRDNRLYYEYGVNYEKIAIEDFEQFESKNEWEED